MASITLRPPFYWADGYATPGLPVSSNAKKSTELWSARKDGRLSITSHLTIKCASNDDYVTAGLSCRVWVLFRMPGDSPFTVNVSFPSGALHTLLTGFIEDECGYSSVRVRALVAPSGRFTSFGDKRIKSDILYNYKSKQSLWFAALSDTDNDDHSWYVSKHPTTPLRYTYPVKGVVKKNDLVWMRVGLSVFISLKANDVTVSSYIKQVAAISKITVTA